jgi:hypothetical protein
VPTNESACFLKRRFTCAVPKTFVIGTARDSPADARRTYVEAISQTYI